LAAVAAPLALLYGQFRLVINHDVAWYLYAARWYGRDCRLYVDCFIDPNPPFVLWMSQAGLGLAALLGIADEDAIRLVYCVVLGVAAALSGHVLRGRCGVPGRAMAPILSAIVLAFLLFQFADFGQRDFLAALAMLPYAILVACRVAGERVPAATGVAIGLFAGFAVCLKPHLVLVLVAVELGAVLSTIRALKPRVAEIAGLAAGIGAGIVALVALDPGYLAFLRKVADYYPHLEFDRASVARGYVEQIGLRGILVLAVVPLLWLDTPMRPMLRIFLFASLGAAASFLVQGKSFTYHRAPLDLFAAGAAILGLAILIVQGWPRLERVPRRQWWTATAAAALALAALGAQLCTAALEASEAVARGHGNLARQVSGLRPADEEIVPLLRAFREDGGALTLARVLRQAGPERAMMLSTSLRPLFPAVNYSGVKYGGRMQSLWFVPRLVAEGLGLRQDSPASASPDFPAIVAADLARARPSYLIVRQGRQIGIADPDFSLMAFLASQPALAGELARYECLLCGGGGRGDRYDIYRRTE